LNSRSRSIGNNLVTFVLGMLWQKLVIYRERITNNKQISQAIKSYPTQLNILDLCRYANLSIQFELVLSFTNCIILDESKVLVLVTWRTFSVSNKNLILTSKVVNVKCWKASYTKTIQRKQQKNFYVFKIDDLERQRSKTVLRNFQLLFNDKYYTVNYTEISK
jgi:hypothetical protein